MYIKVQASDVEKDQDASIKTGRFHPCVECNTKMELQISIDDEVCVWFWCPGCGETSKTVSLGGLE